MYKLTYFDITARGEPARLIFAAAGVKFTDNRVKFQDWPALKASKIINEKIVLQVINLNKMLTCHGNTNY